MKMQPMVALAKFSYGRRNLNPGETFDAHPNHARVLQALKRAQIDPAGQSPKAVPAPEAEQPVREVVTEAFGMAPRVARRRGRRSPGNAE